MELKVKALASSFLTFPPILSSMHLKWQMSIFTYISIQCLHYDVYIIYSWFMCCSDHIFMMFPHLPEWIISLSSFFCLVVYVPVTNSASNFSQNVHLCNNVTPSGVYHCSLFSGGFPFLMLCRHDHTLGWLLSWPWRASSWTSVPNLCSPRSATGACVVLLIGSLS